MAWSKAQHGRQPQNGKWSQFSGTKAHGPPSPSAPPIRCAQLRSLGLVSLERLPHLSLLSLAPRLFHTAMRRQNIPLHALTTAVCVAFLVTVVVLPTPAAAACVYTARSCIRPSRDDPAACVCSAACGSGGTMLQYRYLTEQTDPDVACLLVRRVTVSCSPQPPPCAPTSSTSGGDGGDGSRTTAPSPEAIILEKDDDRTVLIIVCAWLRSGLGFV